jgi:hypothetical protein
VYHRLQQPFFTRKLCPQCQLIEQVFMLIEGDFAVSFGSCELGVLLLLLLSELAHKPLKHLDLLSC